MVRRPREDSMPLSAGERLLAPPSSIHSPRRPLTVLEACWPRMRAALREAFPLRVDIEEHIAARQRGRRRIRSRP
jgi:hypothetical protein